jgi:hypothetical protein
MAFDRRSYIAGYRRGLQMARRELRQAERKIDDEIVDIRAGLCEARRQVERLHRIDDAIEAGEGDWHDMALH